MSETELTDQQQNREHLYKAGQSGNPKGRPKGSRNKLGEAFLKDLLADWEQHGVAAIEACRTDKPDVYLRTVAGILPKELNVKVNEYEEMNDDELIALIRQLEVSIDTTLGRVGQIEGGTQATGGDAQASVLPALH